MPPKNPGQPKTGKELKLKIRSLAVLGLFLFLGAVFAGSKLDQRGARPSHPSSSSSSTPSSRQCAQDSDCLLTLRLDQCCSCSEVSSRQTFLNEKNLIEFKLGEDYSSRQTIACTGVACEPCLPSHGSLFCEEGQCRSGEKNSSVETEKVLCQDPRPEACTAECLQNPPYLCGSDGRSYCSACQACSRPEVEWYILRQGQCELF